MISSAKTPSPISRSARRRQSATPISLFATPLRTRRRARSRTSSSRRSNSNPRCSGRNSTRFGALMSTAPFRPAPGRPAPGRLWRPPAARRSSIARPRRRAAQTRLPRGVRLKLDETRGEWLLLAPERVIKMDAIAVEILQRCDGVATIAAIVDDLRPPIRPTAPGWKRMCARCWTNSPPSEWWTYDRPVKTANPVGLLAELTHRCPLGCPYCSNPLALESRATEIDAETGTACFRRPPHSAYCMRIFPAANRPRGTISGDRRPLRYCRALHQSDHLRDRPDAGARKALADAGLDHVQLSIQDSRRPRPTASPAIRAPSRASWRSRHGSRGRPAAYHERRHPPRQYRARRRNGGARGRAWRRPRRDRAYAILRLGAHQSRRADADRGAGDGGDRRGRGVREDPTPGVIVIDHVIPDYHARYPKACMGGWGKRAAQRHAIGQSACPATRRRPFRASNSGTCATIRWEDIWFRSPAFNAFRGTDWMQEPCRSCPRKGGRLWRLPLPGASRSPATPREADRSATSRRTTTRWRRSRDTPPRKT